MPRWLRKPKSGWGWAGLAFGGLALLTLVVNEYAIHVTSRMVEERLQALAVSEHFTRTPEDIVGPPIPAEKDAAVPLLRAAGWASKLHAQLVGKHSAAALDDPKHKAIQKDVEAAVAADPAFEKDLGAADLLTDYRSPAIIRKPIINTLLPHLQQYRELARIEMIRARSLAAAGRRDEACRIVLRQMRLARKCSEKEPFVISLLVGIAVRSVGAGELNRLLRAGPVSAEIHDGVESEAAEEQFAADALRRSLSSERLLCEEMHDLPPLEFLKNHMLRAWANTDKLLFLDCMQSAIEAADGPATSVEEVEKRVKKAIGALDGYGRYLTPGTAMYLPAVTPMFNALRRHRAMGRCLRVVNAATRTGLAKPSLGDLKLPAAAIIDPFDEKPLRVLFKKEGILVYSVGENLVDDGGAIDATGPNRDVGLGP